MDYRCCWSEFVSCNNNNHISCTILDVQIDLFSQYKIREKKFRLREIILILELLKNRLMCCQSEKETQKVKARAENVRLKINLARQVEFQIVP